MAAEASKAARRGRLDMGDCNRSTHCMSFYYVSLIEHYPHIASSYETAVIAPYMGAHFQPHVHITYHLDIPGDLPPHIAMIDKVTKHFSAILEPLITTKNGPCEKSTGLQKILVKAGLV